jgi:hypothetical protein
MVIDHMFKWCGREKLFLGFRKVQKHCCNVGVILGMFSLSNFWYPSQIKELVNISSSRRLSSTLVC